MLCSIGSAVFGWLRFLCSFEGIILGPRFGVLAKIVLRKSFLSGFELLSVIRGRLLWRLRSPQGPGLLAVCALQKKLLN